MTAPTDAVPTGLLNNTRPTLPIQAWCPVGVGGDLLITLASYTQDGAERNFERLMGIPWEHCGLRVVLIRAEEIAQ